MRGPRRVVLPALALIVVVIAAPASARAADAGAPDTPSEQPEVIRRIAAVPSAMRTDRWTKPMPYPGFDPDEAAGLRYSLFFKRIGYLENGDPRIERQSLRLARDLVADLRDFLRVACRRSVCGDAVMRAARAAGAYLGDRNPRYTLVAHHTQSDHWNRAWTWQVTGGGAAFKVGCDHMQESQWAWCWLDVDVGDDLVLFYQARTRGTFEPVDVAIGKRSDPANHEPLGKIYVVETSVDRKLRLVISGLALAPSKVPGDR